MTALRVVLTGLALGLSIVSVTAQAPARRIVVATIWNGDSTTHVGGMRLVFERKLADRLGQPVDFLPLYLDFSNHTDSSVAESMAVVIKQYIRGPIDLLLAQGPEALSFLAQYRERIQPGVPIVFTDVLSEEIRGGTLPAGTTGVVSELPIQTLPAALGLLPDTRRVAVLGGSSETDRRVARAISEVVATGWPALEVVMLDGQPLDEQRDRLRGLGSNGVVLGGSYRSEGTRGVRGDVLESLSQSSAAPIFGFRDYELGKGIVGGDLLQADRLAERAAELAVRILSGESASAIAPVTERASQLAFDVRQLERWKLNERRLPAGSAVLFRTPTLWTQYKWPVLGAAAVILAQGVLIGGLWLERRQRRRAQAGLADAEQRYRTVADTSADWEYWTQADGSLLYVSPACKSITGYAADEFMSRPALLDEIVVPEDRGSWSEHVTRLRQVPGRSSLQFRIRTRGGEVRWIDHLSAPVTSPDGRDLGMRVSNRDTTERKHAEEALHRALAEIADLRDRLAVDNEYLREQLQPAGIEGIVGDSDAMHYVVAKVRQVAETSTTVLLQGETGVGKGLVAQAIHNLSPRRARPLVAVNCAALPAALVESELFGHEKGAFTGANTRRLGRFEVANGGTLFLDEVGDLPLDLQAKLLRAVQSGEFERIGSSVTLKTDVRLITATHRKLDDEVKLGRFRQDLLYRLNVFPITVPPLRQRREDIPALVAYIIDKQCRRLGMLAPPISRATMKALQTREWPGNIRELENVLERGLIASRGSGRFEIGPDDAAGRGPAQSNAPPGGRTLAEVERDHIVATLERVQGRIEGEGGAADLLGINPSTLRSRMRKHGIRRTPADAARS